VDGDWWSFVAQVVPGVTLLLVGLIAAAPGYALARQARPPRRGRARTAIAYLSGLFAGLFATVLVAWLGQELVEPNAVAGSGLLSAFFCPFVGIARAKWERPRRRQPRVATALAARH
jgi:fructose-specific phosphotransferase system IIC component